MIDEINEREEGQSILCSGEVQFKTGWSRENLIEKVIFE